MTKENKKINKALQKGMESTELKAKKQSLCEIEKECMNILLAAYDAGLGAGIPIFPLEESYFYRFLHLCRIVVENKNGIKNE